MGMMTRRNVKRRVVKKTTSANTFVEIKKPEVSEKEYTKTEINRMPIAELKKLAEKFTVNDFDKMTGAELKKRLVEVLEV